MPSIYKGLTIRLGADTTDLNEGLRRAKREMAGVPTELKKIERALKLDPGNTRLLAQQQELYKKAISSTSEQLRLYRATREQAEAGDIKLDGGQWARLEADIAMCEKRLDGYRSALADSIVQQNAMESSLGRAGARLTAWGEALGPACQRAERIGGVLSRTVTPGLIAMGAAGMAAAVEVDDALTGVRKTVDGTDQQYQALKRSAIEFSKTNAVSASQILDIQALGAQLGYAIDELDEFGEVVSGLDIATNMNAEEAATELAQFANIMGMSHDETRNYGSTIVALGNSFATTEADISHMAMRIAGAAKSIGLTEADVLGLATALSSMGIEAEAGGTAISTIMAQIDADVALNKDSVADWAAAAGMSAAQFADAWRTDAVGTLSAVLVGMDGAVRSGGNLTAMLSGLGIEGIRQSDVMKRLANNSEFLGRAVSTANQAWRENSALDAEVANRNESLSAQFSMLKNRVVAIAESYGGPLCRAMIEVIDAAEPLIEAIASGARSFAEMSEGEQRAVLACLALSAAAGPMLSLFGRGASAITSLGKGFKALSEHMARSREAARQQAAATREQAAASVGAASATGAQASSATMAAAGTTAMGAASTGAAGAMGLLRAAMMALPLVALASAVAVVIPAVAGWVSGMADAAIGTGRLTAASAAQAERVRELKNEYELARVVQGEGSDAAARAKAAYEEESAALEQSRQTLGQFADECRGVVEAHGEMASSMADAEGEAAAQAGTILNLADQVAELVAVEGRSEEQKARLASLSQMLNDAMGEEAVAYDQATDACGLTADAVRALAKAEADRVRGEAAMRRYNALMEDSVAVDAQLARAQEELEAETRRNKEAWGELLGVQVFTSQAQIDLEKQVSDLSAAQAENSDEMDRALQVAQDMAAHDQALSEAVAAVRDGTMSAAEAAEAFGGSLGIAVTEGEVAAQVMTEQASEAAALDEALQKVAEELDEFAAGNAAFSAALAESGWSTSDLAARLGELGMGASDLTKAFEDLQGKTQNAFDAIEYKSGLSLDKMMETLEHNARATRSWGDNISALYARAGDSSTRAFVQYIAGLGVEYAPIVQQLLDDSSGKLEELAAAWADAGEATGDGFLAAQRPLLGEAASQAEAAAVDVSDALASGAPGAQEAGGATGAAYDEGLAAELEGCPESVRSYVAQLEEALAAEQPAAEAGAAAGSAFGGSLDEELAQCPPAVREHVASLEAQLESFGVEASILGASAGDGFTGSASGALRAGEPYVTGAVGSITASADRAWQPVVGKTDATTRAATRSMQQALLDGQGPVDVAAAGLVGSVAGQTAALPGVLGSDARGASRDFAAGLPLYRGAARSSADAMAAEARRMAAGDPYSWGQHLGENFANGIRGATTAVRNAASAVASAVTNILGHTVPREGILREGGEGERRWGRHAGQNYAEGMMQALPDIRHASEALAQAQASALADGSPGMARQARAAVGDEAREAASRSAVVVRDARTDAELAALRRDFSSFRRELGAVINASVPDKVKVNGRELARVIKDSEGAL